MGLDVIFSVCPSKGFPCPVMVSVMVGLGGLDSITVQFMVKLFPTSTVNWMELLLPAAMIGEPIQEGDNIHYCPIQTI